MIIKDFEMDFKKTLLALSVGITTQAFASGYVVVVGSEDVNYEVGEGYTESVSYTVWISDPYNAATCSFDKEASDVYYGESFSKTEECNTPEIRTKTITRTYISGKVETTEEIENRITTTSQVTSDTGTHLESSCNDILNNGYSKGDGTYFIKPSSNSEFNVVCDMTTDGGGWTQIVSNGTTINTPNFKTEINAIWGDGVGKYIRFLTKDTSSAVISTIYYKRNTAYPINFYDNILATFRNTNNILNVDFTMNFDYYDLNTGTNNFNICNYSNEPDPEHTYVGFPRDCNRGDLEGGRWITMDISRSPDLYTPFTVYGYHAKLWIK